MLAVLSEVAVEITNLSARNPLMESLEDSRSPAHSAAPAVGREATEVGVGTAAAVTAEGPVSGVDPVEDMEVAMAKEATAVVFMAEALEVASEMAMAVFTAVALEAATGMAMAVATEEVLALGVAKATEEAVESKQAVGVLAVVMVEVPAEALVMEMD